MPYSASTISIGSACLLIAVGLLVGSSRLAAWVDEHSVTSAGGGHHNRQVRLTVNLTVLGAFFLIVGGVLVGIGVNAAVS